MFVGYVKTNIKRCRFLPILYIYFFLLKIFIYWVSFIYSLFLYSNIASKNCNSLYFLLHIYHLPICFCLCKSIDFSLFDVLYLVELFHKVDFYQLLFIATLLSDCIFIDLKKMTRKNK